MIDLTWINVTSVQCYQKLIKLVYAGFGFINYSGCGGILEVRISREFLGGSFVGIFHK